MSVRNDPMQNRSSMHIGVRPGRPIKNNPMQKNSATASKLPMHRSRRCGAKTRSGHPCQSPAMTNGRCRLHGGLSPGPPKGNKNALKHGRYTAEAIAQRREARSLPWWLGEDDDSW
jgi:hypothetical protein